MQAIVEATLSKDDTVQLATSAYIDDIFINEDIASATRVRQHLANFGLASKEPKRLQNCARVLDLELWERRPKRTTGPYPMQHVLVLWKASRALPSG